MLKQEHAVKHFCLPCPVKELQMIIIYKNQTGIKLYYIYKK